ncbi:hypothetical protein BOTU111922_21080 [Bordetella tumulicola]
MFAQAIKTEVSALDLLIKRRLSMLNRAYGAQNEEEMT